MAYAQPFGRRKHVRAQGSFLTKMRGGPHGRLLKRVTRSRGLSGWFDDLLSTGKSIVGGLPQVSSALNVVKAKVGDFLNLPLRLDRAFKTIQGRKAETVGTSKVTKWNTLEQGVRLLQQKYPSVESRLTTVLAKKDQGVSLSLLAEAVPVAAEVTGMLKAMSKIESEMGSSPFVMPPFVQGAVGWLPLVGLGAVALWFIGRRR